MKMQSALKELGLNANEAAVYLFLVQNGARYATQIQAALGMDKVPVYRALSALKDKEYVHSIGETRNQQFAARPIQKLLAKYDQRAEQLAAARLDIETFVRNLADKQHELYKENKIQVFEGTEGYRLWNEERLRGRVDTIREFGQNIFLEEFFSPAEFDEYMRAYIKRRVAKGIRIMSMGDARRLRDFDASAPALLKEQRVVNTPENMDIFMSTFGSRFGFYTRQGGRYLGIIIDDSMLAMMITMFFDAMWDKGQKI